MALIRVSSSWNIANLPKTTKALETMYIINGRECPQTETVGGTTKMTGMHITATAKDLCAKYVLIILMKFVRLQ